VVFIITLLYILVALLIFGLLIFIHEFGHFICARIFGVGVKEFAIGFGPTLFSWRSKKYDTKYGLRLFPLGGFVSMVGEDEASDAENAFCNKSVWKRICIVLAGPVMNVLLGFLLMLILVLGQGALASTTIAKFDENALSSEKLCVEDKIVKVGKTGVYTFQDVIYEIMNQGYEPVDITVIRNGKKIVVEDVVFPVVNEQGAEFGEYDFSPYADDPTVLNYIKHAYFRSVSTVKMVVDSFIDLLGGRYGMEAISGPVGVTEVMVDAAKAGFFTLLYVVIVISMNLGVFNLVPYPVFDGGRILLLLIEAVRRKPLKKEVEGYINFVGMMILFAFMAFIIVKDVFGLF
jgi:regulator of sigma E protease